MARPQRTHQQPGTYTYEQQHGLMILANSAVTSQLLAAAEFVSHLFQANGVPFALMGGFALKLRGNTRDTHDVDVAIGCTMLRLIEVLSGQTRILRPAGPTSGVMRVFVLVGGELNPGISELWVTVDMILEVSLGAPEHPQSSSEVISFNTSTGIGQLPVINILAAMASKLNAYYSRQQLNDYDDILFLIMEYPEQVTAIRTQLNAIHRQWFVGSFAARGNKDNAIRRVKHVLGVVQGL